MGDGVIMTSEGLEFQLAALRAEVVQLRADRGGATPFEFRTPETPMAAYPEQYSRVLNPGVYESTEPVPGSTVRRVWAFACWPNRDLNGIVMEPGDVWFGPISVTHWDDIDGASTTPGVTSGYPCAWLEVHVNTLDVSMVVGTKPNGNGVG